MLTFTFYGLLFASLTIRIAAQAYDTCILPESYDIGVILDVGAILVVNDNPRPDDASACNSSSEIVGPVYLYRPEDPEFIPRQVGYYNSLNISNPEIIAPAVDEYGYGYRVSIVPDRDSPRKTVWTSTTFALVTSEWHSATSYEIQLYLPLAEGTLWYASGQQLIQWGNYTVGPPPITSIDMLLYQSQDASWGPIVLASDIPVGGPSLPDYDYYTPARDLPVGSNYQVVLIDHAVGTAGVLAVSGFIQIVDYPVPYPTDGLSGTQLSTIHPGPTPR